MVGGAAGLRAEVLVDAAHLHAEALLRVVEEDGGGAHAHPRGEHLAAGELAQQAGALGGQVVQHLEVDGQLLGVGVADGVGRAAPQVEHAGRVAAVALVRRRRADQPQLRDGARVQLDARHVRLRAGAPRPAEADRGEPAQLACTCTASGSSVRLRTRSGNSLGAPSGGAACSATARAPSARSGASSTSKRDTVPSSTTARARGSKGAAASSSSTCTW